MIENRIESLRFSPVENVTTGTIATLSPHDTSMIFFTGAGAVTVESISYGAKGKVLKLANLTGSTLTLKHNTGSINKNRIITSDATDLVIQNNQIVSLLYDHVNSRWKIDGAASGGGGGASSLPANRIPYGDGSSTYLNSERAKFNPAETFDAFTVAALTLGDLSSGIEAGIQLKPDNVGFLVTDKKTTASTNSRPLLIKSGDTSGTTSNSGAFTLKSGDVLTSGTSGNLSIKSGIGTTGTGTFASGSGNASAGSSGATSIGSGTGTTGTGNLTLNTGNASAGPSGSVNISTGTATGTRGSITLSAKDITVSAGAINEIKGTDVPSAGTVDLTAATGNLIHITGTTTITAITLGSGYERTVVFDGALILTHNATTLILPSGANITTAAGDTAIFRGDGSGNTRCISYTKASGAPIVSSGGGSPYFDDDGGSPSVAPSALGTDSIAIGEGASVASGATNSFAIGTSSSVSTSITNAIAFGKSSSAGGASAIAIGEESDATALNSIAIGKFSQATGYHTIAIGSSSTLANAPTSASSYAISIGFNSLSNTVDGISMGRSAETFSQKSIAIGLSSKVLYSSSARGIAIGNSAVVGHNSQATFSGIAIGYGSKSYKNSSATYSPVAIGTGSHASANHSICIGTSSIASALSTIAIGNTSTASGSSSIGFGDNSNASGTYNIALGRLSKARIEKTIQLQATSIIRKDDGDVLSSGTDTFMWGSGNESVIMTKEIDLKPGSAPVTTTITVPTGSRFYPNEVGLILTTLGGTITGQPDVSFGITGTNNKFVTQTTSSLNAIYERDAYTPLTTTGESTLTFTVNVAATGSADIKGRAYFKGILVEIQ